MVECEVARRLGGRLSPAQVDELERLAREEYGYAKVGEEVYHVLPPPRDPLKVPDAWPFTRLAP